jgi:hypothetical protein
MFLQCSFRQAPFSRFDGGAMNYWQGAAAGKGALHEEIWGGRA